LLVARKVTGRLRFVIVRFAPEADIEEIEVFTKAAS
jgi:hypothetical protein